MNAYSPKEYWTGVAEKFHSHDPAGLAPVLHPGAPAWFNRLIDDLQFRAVQRALALAQIQQGSRVLDVGCGTGRWLRRYQGIGFLPTGVDATSGMLRLARQHGTAVPLVAAEAHHLPFANAEFDSVSDITVVQHIPVSLQPQAIGEMMRVLKPGGHLILIELIRGRGAHIFPHSPKEWIQQVTSCDATLIKWFGQEFLPLDRLFVRLAQALANTDGRSAGGSSLPAQNPEQHVSAARRVYWGLRHITAVLSVWTDPFVEKICPAQLATHGVFVFRK
jgi:ubiquinone/menaquinone biosynthesis C-methylase UbiE